MTKREFFNVITIATMSSGKSTIINAMLGRPLLPSKNEACTATVIKIKDSDLEGFKARAIKVNKDETEWFSIDYDDPKLEEWNTPETECIEIEGDFLHIDNNNKSIHIYDTPGPNNSSDISHSEITHNILSNSNYGFILCIMNASQFGVDDEKILLETISNELNKKAQKTKIVFVVNKIDQLDIEAGETPINLINNIKKYLRTLGFSRPHVIPVMSLLSLEIRQILNSYKNNHELMLSKRKEKRLLKDLDYLLDFQEDYIKAIMNTKSKTKYHERAKMQDRGVSIKNSIELAGKKLSIKQLIEADILTGIPILEEMLEVELLKDSGTYYKRNKK